MRTQVVFFRILYSNYYATNGDEKNGSSYTQTQTRTHLMATFLCINVVTLCMKSSRFLASTSSLQEQQRPFIPDRSKNRMYGSNRGITENAKLHGAPFVQYGDTYDCLQPWQVHLQFCLSCWGALSPQCLLLCSWLMMSWVSAANVQGFPDLCLKCIAAHTQDPAVISQILWLIYDSGQPSGCHMLLYNACQLSNQALAMLINWGGSPATAAKGQ